MSVERTRPAVRASDKDRDDVLVRLHTAYAEGRLTEGELDERIDLVLASRTQEDLDRLSADLPTGAADAVDAAPSASGLERSGFGSRFQLAYKDHVRRVGRWFVPQRYTSVIYKGGAVLDLRTAELESPITSIRVLAYKSTVEILVPAGARVIAGGVGVSTDVHGATDGGPVIHVQGFAYKGRIEAKDHPARP
ncbi:DUF1707 domain-containing protein [Actinomadura barringtoniae]|uniref:DUF1707 domain-containing protein n=1 Tax=Actinomadura barringtoniae TaxID=1427535 RepID=A0A939T8I8_9ACTN|nr:DUF1707 domain-containing protein [Actinomadura barringtoniae]MBO2450382.1 DUF1707 domain-containing protein [Actinomadura barringtoniae]